MSFNPTYIPPGTAQRVGDPQAQSLTIGGQQVPGDVTTWQSTGADGTNQTVTNWTASIHTDDLWDTSGDDRSTFTGTIQTNAAGANAYVWSATSNDSVTNLVNDYNAHDGSTIDISTSDVNSAFNTTGSTGIQSTLNNTRDQQLLDQYISPTCDQDCAQQQVNASLPTGTVMNNQSTLDGDNTTTYATLAAQNATQNIDVTINADYVRQEYGDYCYPDDIRTNGQDRIKFTMKQYGGVKINTTNMMQGGVAATGRNYTNIQGSVTLPIQPKIQDRNAVDWGHQELNVLQARAAGLGLAMARQSSLGDAMNTAANALGQAYNELSQDDNITKALQVWLVGQGVGAQNLLSRASGAIANPNMELLFRAPQLRSFNYQFQLSARDVADGNQIRQIIRFFKQGSAIKTTPNNVFLKTPNVFDIKYLTYDGTSAREHPSINRIKTCALNSVAVDYTPGNSYMTYNDDQRTMTAYGLNLSFTELDPIYEKDYHVTPPGSTGINATDSRAALTTNEIGY